MFLSIPHAKEALNYAHIYATAAMARVNLSAKLTEHDVFDYGVDGAFEGLVDRGDKVIPSGFAIHYQAKATQQWSFEGEDVVYDLSSRAYNNIVERHPASPRLILILLCLPPLQEHWHATTEDQTTIRQCCYFHWFEGEPTLNASTKRIRIPRKNLFTPQALTKLLELEDYRQRSKWL